VISGEGVVVEPEKVKAIVDWERLHDVQEIQSFLELAGYYNGSLRDSRSCQARGISHKEGCSVCLDRQVQAEFPRIEEAVGNCTSAHIAYRSGRFCDLQ
jgi:hypothetical protein